MALKSVRILLTLFFFTFCLRVVAQDRPNIYSCTAQEGRLSQRLWWVRYTEPRPENLAQYIDDIYLEERFETGPAPLYHYKRFTVFYEDADPSVRTTPPADQHFIYRVIGNRAQTLLQDGAPDWLQELGDYGCAQTLTTNIRDNTRNGMDTVANDDAPAALENAPTRHLLSPVYDDFFPLPTASGTYHDQVTPKPSRGNTYQVLIPLTEVIDTFDYQQSLNTYVIEAYQYAALKSFYETRLQAEGWLAKQADAQILLTRPNNEATITLTFDIDYNVEKLVMSVQFATKDGESGLIFQPNQQNIDVSQCTQDIDLFDLDTPTHNVELKKNNIDGWHCLIEKEGDEEIRRDVFDPTVTNFLPGWLTGQD